MEFYYVLLLPTYFTLLTPFLCEFELSGVAYFQPIFL